MKTSTIHDYGDGLLVMVMGLLISPPLVVLVLTKRHKESLKKCFSYKDMLVSHSPQRSHKAKPDEMKEKPVTYFYNV